MKCPSGDFNHFAVILVLIAADIQIQIPNQGFWDQSACDSCHPKISHCSFLGHIWAHLQMTCSGTVRCSNDVTVF